MLRETKYKRSEIIDFLLIPYPQEIKEKNGMAYGVDNDGFLEKLDEIIKDMQPLIAAFDEPIN